MLGDKGAPIGVSEIQLSATLISGLTVLKFFQKHDLCSETILPRSSIRAFL